MAYLYAWMQARDAQGHAVTRGEAPFAIRVSCGDEEVAGKQLLTSPDTCLNPVDVLLRSTHACSDMACKCYGCAFSLSSAGPCRRSHVHACNSRF